MKLSKREKILIIVMGLALFGFVYYKFVFTSENKSYNKINSEYIARKPLIDEAKNKDIKIKDINSQIEKIQKDIDSLQGKTSEPILVPEVVNDLDIAAAKCTVTLNNIQFSGNAASIKGRTAVTDQNVDGTAQPTAPTQSNVPDQMKTLTVELSFIGNYSSCMNFIKYYENNKRLFVVERLGINGSGGNCNVIMKMSTYSINEKDPAFKYNAGDGSPRISPFN